MKWHLLAVVAAGAVVGGCTAPSAQPADLPSALSPETRAEQFATQACGITWLDANGNSVEQGEGTATYSVPDRSYDPALERLTNLMTWSEDWKVIAVDAAAAAQLDSTWDQLSYAASTVNEKLQLLVSVRQDGFAGARFWQQNTYGPSDQQAHAEAHMTFNTQCGALAKRL